MGILKMRSRKPVKIWAFRWSSLTQDPGSFNRAHRPNTATQERLKRAISRVFTMQERRLDYGTESTVS